MLRLLTFRVLTISFLAVHLFIFVNHPSAPAASAPPLLLPQPQPPPPPPPPPKAAQAHPPSQKVSPVQSLYSQQNASRPESNTTKNCYDGRSLVVVITRSVVAPKRRPQRLEAISRTWGRDLVRIGATVMVLSMEPESECVDLLFTCLTPPMDLVTRKSEVFTWLITKVLLPLDGPSRVSHFLW